MEKNSWKELAILLLLLSAVIITLEIGAPTLIDKVWDAIRNFFHISLAMLFSAI